MTPISEFYRRAISTTEPFSPAAACMAQYLEGTAEARSNGRPHRLLVVSNRLPVSGKRRGEDSWSLDEISAGGLVSGLLGVMEFEARWIGWAGVAVPDAVGQKALTRALAEKKCIPVFLDDEETADQYYNGYCNSILWPLFHYLGLPQDKRLATKWSYQSQFEAYEKANKMFAAVVNDQYEEGDIVWCHDFHLMLLPKYLKEYNSKMKVGWFMHSPIPSSEILRTLPSRSDLLRAVLAADIVGFHAYDYTRNFVSACTRILGLEGTPEGVEDQGRLTRVATFPIGIDPERFMQALELPQVHEHIREFKERFSGKKVILGVDRLDMIKGIPQKILAFEKFLEENQHWRDKVVLLQIAVPTRTDVPEYQKYRSQVHEIVGRINGRFGSLSGVPIHHLDRSIDFNALCALYAVSDVALVTSLRDGMNLVSYEFVACQDSKRGVLILSEFAGAAESLGAGAILVNPWNTTEVAAAIGQALNMQPEERERRHRLNFEHVRTHTAQQWAEFFVSQLNDNAIEAQSKTPPQLTSSDAISRYTQSTNRLLILGCNATLTKSVDATLKLHPELKESLTLLCNDPNTIIIVLSGSDRNVLDKNFGEYNMWLAAENGMFLRSTNGEWKTTMPEHLINMNWVDSVRHVLEYFTERTPGSRFERRETSLVWNYEYSDLEFGRMQARDMLENLWTGPISNSSVDVVQGSRSVEVRADGVTKGAAMDRILGEIVRSEAISTPIDFVMCVGHFFGKDEDVYTFFEPELAPDSFADAMKVPAKKRQAPKPPPCRSSSSSSSDTCWNVLDLKKENYYSVAVGRQRTNARYILNTADDVVAFLKELAAGAPH